MWAKKLIRLGAILCVLAAGGCASMKFTPSMTRSSAPAPQASPDLITALNEAATLVTDLRYDEAVDRLRLLLPSLQASGDAKRTAEAMFWIGYCHEHQSRFDQATVWYRRVMGEYPDTPAAEQARQRLPRLESPQ